MRRGRREAVDALLDEPFGNWHVDTTTEAHQLRVTKKGEALVHTRRRAEAVEVDRDHDRDKGRLLPDDDPVLVALGISDHEGRVKPSRQAKYRQVEEFLRILDASIATRSTRATSARPTADEPLRVVDLGCGNAYLTFAAHRFLTDVRGLPVRLTGVDVREQSRAQPGDRQRGRHRGRLRASGRSRTPTLDPAPEVVLALHACDTATDEALARAVAWEAPLVLAAPCCHHDIAAQLRRGPTPAPYAMLIRHGILRERFADTLTDALRASLLRLQGYRVDVMQFVESEHTPRNTMLRAVRTGDAGRRRRCARSTTSWWRAGRCDPRLAELLGDMALREATVARALVVVPFGLGAAAAAGSHPTAGGDVFRFQDPAIVESSGLAVVDGLFVTVNDSGDTARVFTVDPRDRETVGVTGWADEPSTSRRWRRPGAARSGSATSATTTPSATVSVARVPVGRGDRTSSPRRTSCVYPGGPRDAETLLADPGDGRLVRRDQGRLRRQRSSPRPTGCAGRGNRLERGRAA